MRSAVSPAVLALSACLAGLPACAGRDYAFERETVEPKERESEPASRRPTLATLEARFREVWPRRDDPAELALAIGMLKQIDDVQGGKSYETLVLLSRACYLQGEIESEAAKGAQGAERERHEERRREAYEAGMRYGDLALHTIPAFRAAFERSRSLEDAVSEVPIEGIAAIYWDAVNQGKWASARGMVKVLFMKEKVKKMIERVLALDERWWYGAAHRYLGAYYAALPSFAGRDLAKSKDHFERSLAIAPDFLATRVLMAEYWARAANDRRAYREQLERVLAASPDAIPEVAPEQRLEQKKARRLLAEIDDYFEPEEPAAGPEKGQ